MDRRPNTQSLQWFLDRHNSGELDLDPPFQRRSVWSLDYQRYFIDTLLRDYPSPPIFLEVEIEPGVPTKYNVLDGKQRLTAVFSFLEGGFHLAGYQAEEGHEDAYWEDLPEEMRRAFVHYDFSVENITDTRDAELRDAFKRLNRNVERLKPQELRHAQFPGAFLDRMENLATSQFWSETRIVTVADVRRMRDIEFVSELFLLTMHGVLDGKRELLDRYYADYADEIPNEAEHLATFEEIQEYLRQLDLDWRATRWSNMSDFYAVWGAILRLREGGDLPEPAVAAERLTAFSEMQSDILRARRERQPIPGSERDELYGDAVRQGPNKDTNRAQRIEILTELLSE